MPKSEDPINLKNRKAHHDYELLDKFIAGIQLSGSEIKSIRGGGANLSDSFCFVNGGEVFIKNLHIAEYENAGFAGHEPKRDRKLLLNKQEIKKIEKKVKDVGLTIVPTKLFINAKGWAKVEIAIARGKKQFDKRETLKEKDIQRQMKRTEKGY